MGLDTDTITKWTAVWFQACKPRKPGRMRNGMVDGMGDDMGGLTLMRKE